MIKARHKKQNHCIENECTDNDITMMGRLNGDRISEYVNERKSKLNVQYLLHNVAKRASTTKAHEKDAKGHLAPISET